MNVPLSPMENRSLFVMSDMLLDADVTAACKIFLNDDLITTVYINNIFYYIYILNELLLLDN